MTGLSCVEDTITQSFINALPAEAAVAAGIPGARGEPCVWTGRSGRSFAHTRYSLVGCPELPRANYILVRRNRAGEGTVLAVGRVEHAAPSLNLAELRQLGAKMKANEVHILVSAGGIRERRRVERDLRGVCIPGPVASQNA